MALPAFLPTAPSKQLEEGEGFEPATFRLRVRRLIPYTSASQRAARVPHAARGRPECGTRTIFAYEIIRIFADFFDFFRFFSNFSENFLIVA